MYYLCSTWIARAVRVDTKAVVYVILLARVTLSTT